MHLEKYADEYFQRSDLFEYSYNGAEYFTFAFRMQESNTLPCGFRSSTFYTVNFILLAAPTYTGRMFVNLYFAVHINILKYINMYCHIFCHLRVKHSTSRKNTQNIGIMKNYMTKLVKQR